MRSHAVALEGRHARQGTDAVVSALCRPQRRPRRGVNPMLKSGISREILRIICGDEERSRRRARARKTAPDVRCGDAARTGSPVPGSIRRRRSGGPPAEPAHRFRFRNLGSSEDSKKEKRKGLQVRHEIPISRILSELDGRKRTNDD